MTYSDRDIYQAMARGEIDISPFDHTSMQPASYDCRLYPKLLVYDTSLPAEDQDPLEVSLDDSDFLMEPGQFVLGCTEEYISLSEQTTCMADGKSSLGRQGLFIAHTAGWCDPGFEGQITLEFCSSLPIWLQAGMHICQLIFSRTDSPAIDPYGISKGSYQGQRGPTPTRRGYVRH